jgi:putative SOS response-associated peptidase YedK
MQRSCDQTSMCNEYLRYKGFRGYADEFNLTNLPIRFPPSHLAPNLEPQERVRPTDKAPIFRAYEDGVDHVQCAVRDRRNVARIP